MLPSEAAAQALRALQVYPPPIQQQASLLSRKLLLFGFGALFERCIEGPVVRTFSFKPVGDVKFASILNKAEEIAGALGVESVTIERVLGNLDIAVPRADRQLIRFDACLHTMMSSPVTKDMQLPLLMGQSKEGEFLYADLASQPHMLIAGATGSGKSVYTAQLICSLSLFRSVEELEFILVDTKSLDLVLFKGLEHVKYVLSTIEDIRAALQKLLEEVRLRNTQMSGLVRNIREWNGLRASVADKKMLYKVFIMDELADVVDQDEEYLRMFSKKERPVAILDLLKTIAQISRAAGVHLVLATQRPSVDILPGSIKTNFPARVSFKLPTRTDSQVILDENGAESLLGQGDYLYKIAGSDVVRRAHSAFVSITDIATIVAQNEQIRKQYESISERLC
jgi:DNA segregation ATPase FtsK/SpoIIIE, S-DNA-T family